MLRVCIVEDEPECVETLKRMLRQFLQGEPCSVRVFGDGMNFVSDYTPEYDVVFMDIEMPYLNGMKAARKMRKLDAEVQLVFVTHLAKYALQGYEVDAAGYLLKPLEYFSFANRMKRILAKRRQGRGEELYIKSPAGVVRIDPAKLKYVEVIDHFLIYHTADGDYKAYGQLQKLEQELPPPYFFRVNKSYIVNFRYVDKMVKESIVIDKAEILISRSKLKPCRAAFNEYLEGTING